MSVTRPPSAARANTAAPFKSSQTRWQRCRRWTSRLPPPSCPRAASRCARHLGGCGTRARRRAARAFRRAKPRRRAQQLTALASPAPQGDRINGLVDGVTGDWYCKFDTFHPAVDNGLPVTRVISRVTLQGISAGGLPESAIRTTARLRRTKKIATASPPSWKTAAASRATSSSALMVRTRSGCLPLQPHGLSLSPCCAVQAFGQRFARR